MTISKSTQKLLSVSAHSSGCSNLQRIMNSPLLLPPKPCGEFLLLPNSKIRLLREGDSGPLYLYISGIGSLQGTKIDNNPEQFILRNSALIHRTLALGSAGRQRLKKEQAVNKLLVEARKEVMKLFQRLERGQQAKQCIDVQSPGKIKCDS